MTSMTNTSTTIYPLPGLISSSSISVDSLLSPIKGATKSELICPTAVIMPTPATQESKKWRGKHRSKNMGCVGIFLLISIKIGTGSIKEAK